MPEVLTLGRVPTKIQGGHYTQGKNLTAFGSATNGLGMVGEPYWHGAGFLHPAPQPSCGGGAIPRPTSEGCGPIPKVDSPYSPFGGKVNGLKLNGLAGVGDYPVLERVGWALSIAGASTGAYHGYKRNKSVGWAIVWGLLGGIAPIITIPVSLAQGYGKRKR